MGHLSEDTLLDYYESEDKAKFAEESLHLATCSICRKKLAQLNQAEEALMQSQEWRQNSVELARLEGSEDKYSGLEQQLRGVEGLILQDEIKADPLKLKAALHALTHEQAMASALSLNEPVHEAARQSVIEPVKSPSWSNRISQRLSGLVANNLSGGVFGTNALAAMAFVGVLMFTGLFTVWNSEPLVAYYQDNPSITYSNDGIPAVGVGFFAAANNVQEPFAGVSVTDYDNSSIELEWPSIAGAERYYIEVVKIRSGVSSVVAKLELDGNVIENNSESMQEAEVPWQTSMDDLSGRYEWTLSGQTGDQRRFEAQGGFVLSES